MDFIRLSCGRAENSEASCNQTADGESKHFSLCFGTQSSQEEGMFLKSQKKKKKKEERNFPNHGTHFVLNKYITKGEV